MQITLFTLTLLCIILHTYYTMSRRKINSRLPEDLKDLPANNGLSTLAQIIARHHLRLKSLKSEQTEDKETDNGNENKDLPDS